MRHNSEFTSLFSELLNSSDVGFAIVDEQLRYVAVNEKLARMNGIPANKHVGRRIRDVLGDALAEQLEPAIRKVFATAQPVHVEGHAGLPNQQPRAVATLFPFHNDAGTITQVGGIVMQLADAGSTEGRTLLRSWKEIAHFLDTCVRTAQRWERLYGLPVRRIEEKNGAVVFATKAELTAWIKSKSKAKKSAA